MQWDSKTHKNTHSNKQRKQKKRVKEGSLDHHGGDEPLHGGWPSLNRSDKRKTWVAGWLGFHRERGERGSILVRFDWIGFVFGVTLWLNSWNISWTRPKSMVGQAKGPTLIDTTTISELMANGQNSKENIMAWMTWPNTKLKGRVV